MSSEIEGQLTIYDYLSQHDPSIPPEFNSSLMDGIIALDVFVEKYPETPVYFVTKAMHGKNGAVSPTFYKAMVCIYTGWWHGLQGWNIENKYIESWELIEGYTVSDFIGKGLMMALTPEQYEKNKHKSTKEIVEMILRNEFKRKEKNA